MPSLITVLATTTFVATVVYFPSEMREYFSQLFYGSVFLENFYQTKNEGYFAAPSESNILLHLWSLSIEEQFYLILPLSLWIVHELGLNKFLFISIALLLSFAVNIDYSYADTTTSYFSSIGRIWQLLSGSLVALYVYNRTKSNATPAIPTNFYHYKNIITFCAIVLLLVEPFFIEKNYYPGFQSLIPTTCTIALLLFAQYTTITRKILEQKSLVFTGLVSYPLYLWHWPILVAYKTYYSNDIPLYAPGLIIIISFILASWTYWYIEKPIRNNKKIGS